jgi:hypothetical protein
MMVLTAGGGDEQFGGIWTHFLGSEALIPGIKAH